MAELIMGYLPNCPLCKSGEGYEISGFGNVNAQCKSCKAKWLIIVHKDKGKVGIKSLFLRETKASVPKYFFKEHPITFWQSSDIEQLTENEQIFGNCDKCGKTIPIGSTYWYEKEQRLLPDKKFCSKQCFTEALTEQRQHLIKEGKLPPEWVSEAAGAGLKTIKTGLVVCSVLFVLIVLFLIWLWFVLFR